MQSSHQLQLCRWNGEVNSVVVTMWKHYFLFSRLGLRSRLCLLGFRDAKVITSQPMSPAGEAPL